MEQNINNDINEKAKTKKLSYQTKIKLSIIIPIILLIIIIICIVNISNSKKIININYTENSQVNYNVCLLENKYYEKSCIFEEQEYLSTITNVINADFSYNAVFDDPKDVEYSYFIDADVSVIKNNESRKKLYNKIFTLKDPVNYKVEKQVVNIVESIEIPFSKYNDLVNEFLTNYGLDSLAQVNVSLKIRNNTNNSVSKVAELNIPLSSQTFSIEKSIYENKVTNEVLKEEIDPKRIIFITLLIVSVILLIASIIYTYLILSKLFKRDSNYNKQLKRILSEYDKIIVNRSGKTVETDNKSIEKVESFLELVDVRDTLGKPIMYVKVNSIKSEFYINDGNVIYKYIMKASNFNKED